MKRWKKQREHLTAAAAELLELRESLNAAYSAFNSAADPTLAEASILELTALQSRYGLVLRGIKAIAAELEAGRAS